MDYRCLFVE